MRCAPSTSTASRSRWWAGVRPSKRSCGAPGAGVRDGDHRRRCPRGHRDERAPGECGARQARLLAGEQLRAGRRRQARGVVSAGNSGAMLAAALFTIKRIPGHRATRHRRGVPQRGRSDVHARRRRQHRLQAGVAGAVRADGRRLRSHHARHRAARASACSATARRSEKGSELVQAAHPLIAALPINFVGNVEGKDIFRGGCDVVVTDGFTGNVVLKVAEGIGEFLFASIAREARKSHRRQGRRRTAQAEAASAA